jgi:hypothetical protein
MHDFLQTHFETIWWLSLGWVIVFSTVMYFWYRSQGRFFADPLRGTTIYEERFASGCSQKSAFTRIGSARNCLRLWITADRLYVRPFFPFSIVGPLYDLVHCIPLERIERLRTREGFMAKSIDVSFSLPDGTSRTLTIWPSSLQDFKDTLNAAIDKKTRPNQALQTTSVTRSGFGKVSVSDRQGRGV